MESLTTYIPLDRRLALAYWEAMPDRTIGSALLADLSGFTALATTLVEALGPQRAVEKLTQYLNQIYETLISEVHAYGGSVVGLVGDAITCWFDQDQGERAIVCALAMQQAMASLGVLPLTSNKTVKVTMKAGIATGAVRRFLVGDLQVQYIDVLAGKTMTRMSGAEDIAQEGEVVLSPETATNLAQKLKITGWRSSPDLPETRYAIVSDFAGSVIRRTEITWPELSVNRVRPWLFPDLYDRLTIGNGQFWADLRPAVALFLKFSDLDYDQDEKAGWKLDAYVRWVQYTLLQYEGYLIQLTIGDKGSFLYAVFGAPVAHTDDALRAIRVAFELINPPAPLDFITTTQIGLAQGQMRTGAYGSASRRSYGVIGEPAIIASRLMIIAPPGQIYCDDSIYQAAAAHFDFEVLSPAFLPGRSNLTKVYRPHLTPLVEPPPLIVSTMSSPITQQVFVGRKLELARLVRGLAAIASGESRFVLLEGEAGIGKSRLVAELLRRIRQQNIANLAGYGYSIEQQTPYRAWRDVFNGFFEFDAEVDLARRQRMVEARVRTAAPEFMNRLALLNLLLNLSFPETDFTQSLTPDLSHQNLATFLLALLRDKLADGPLVIILEDAHWLDSLSWDLILYLARHLNQAGFFLLIVTRPLTGESRRFQQAQHLKLTSLAQADLITLDHLSLDEAQTFMQSYWDGQNESVDSELARLIYERSDGNPFFIESFIHLLSQSSLNTPIQAMVELLDKPDRPDKPDNEAGDPKSQPVLDLIRGLPNTIQGILLARLDQLTPQEQVILRTAAVIGPSFAYPPLCHALRSVVSMSDSDLKTYLEALIVFGFLEKEGVEAGVNYRFKHVITQEVAYQTLLFEQRRQLHKVVAEWYELTPALLPMHLTKLVHHYGQAEDQRKERRYARLAGEQAAGQFANTEALTYLNRALTLTPAMEQLERYALLSVREDVYNIQGNREAQARDLHELQDLVADLGYERLQTEVVLRQARYATATSDYQGATAALMKAIELAQVGRTRDLEAQSYWQLGYLLWRQGRFEAAQERLNQALDLARAADLLQIEADSRRILGGIASDQGYYTKASTYAEEASRLYQMLGDQRGRARALNNLGLIFNNQGYYTKANDYYKQALAVHQEIGYQRGEANSRQNLGLTAWKQGDYAGAKGYYTQARTIYQEIGDKVGEGTTLAYLSLIAHYQGDDEQARKHSQAGLVTIQTFHRPTRAFLQMTLGHALAGLNHMEGATQAYQKALSLYRQPDPETLAYEALAMETLAGLARLALVQGNLPQAQTYTGEILDYLQHHDLQNAVDPARIYLTLYQVLKAAQDAQALNVLKTAHQLIQRQALKMADKAMQSRFLTDIPSHRKIILEFNRIF